MMFDIINFIIGFVLLVSSIILFYKGNIYKYGLICMAMFATGAFVVTNILFKIFKNYG